MTLQGLLETLGQIAIGKKLVNWAGAGTSIYRINDLNIHDYPCFFASPTGTHRAGENFTTYNLTLFYFSRLLEDNSNELDIQSTAMEALKDIIRSASQEDGILETADEYTITLFNEYEKFKDRCTGAFATIDITVANGTTCPADEDETTGYTFTLLTPTANALASGDTGIYAAWETDIPFIKVELLDYNMRQVILTGGTGWTEFSYSIPPNTDTAATRTYTLRIIGPSNYIPTDLRATVTYTQAAAEPVTPTGETEYLTFEILSAGTIEHDGISFDSIYISKNGGVWQNMAALDPWDMEAGDTVRMKGNHTSYSRCTFTKSTAVFNLRGNIMSLIYGDDFIGNSEFPSGTTHNFFRLFADTEVRSAADLVLPATTHTDSCYRDMFMSSGIVEAPNLPPAAFAPHSCEWMFLSCHNLAHMDYGAAEVMGGTAAEYCCSQMFRFTSIGNFDLQFAHTAPYCFELMFADTPISDVTIRPATLSAHSCRAMFKNCPSLETIHCNATTFGTDATSEWVQGVAESGTFYKNQYSSWESGENGIPEGWTVEDYE